MVTAKLAFVLIQTGTSLWVNPMQVEGILVAYGARPANCATFIAGPAGLMCSDWPIDRVKDALSSAIVAKAMEGNR